MKLNTTARRLTQAEISALESMKLDAAEYAAILCDSAPKMNVETQKDRLLLHLTVPLPIAALPVLQKSSGILDPRTGKPVDTEDQKKAFGPVLPMVRFVVRRSAMARKLLDLVEQGIAMEHACPTCGAKPGENCDSRTLGRHPFHPSRVDDANRPAVP